MRTIVVGGGPAGMMAAFQSKQNNDDVLLIEKNKRLGKKLLMTGHGRCNVTNFCDAQTFMKNINTNPKFMYSAYHRFSSLDMLNFLDSQNIETKEEDNHRMFPVSDSAFTILEMFESELKDVIVHLNEEVTELIIQDSKCVGVKTKYESYYADKIILCTGGKSYPLTGSDGSGLEMVKDFHTISECRPALTSLVIKDEWIKNCQGLALKNVEIKLQKKKFIGDVLCTHFGLSGPVILNLSSLFEFNNTVIELDLFPKKSEEEFGQYLLDLISKFQKKRLNTMLSSILPSRFVDEMLKHLKIDGSINASEMKKEQRKKIAYTLKHLQITVVETRGFKEAMVTKGGVSTKEINPNTMESKKIQNLFFAGEIIDVDAKTGGFNLQIAWSTGFVAGN